jgi:hypothetical protein
MDRVTEWSIKEEIARELDDEAKEESVSSLDQLLWD